MRTNNILKAMDQFEKIANNSLRKMAQQAAVPVSTEFQNYLNYVLRNSKLTAGGKSQIDVDGKFGEDSQEAMQKIMKMYIGYSWDRQNLSSDNNLQTLKQLFQDLRAGKQDAKASKDYKQQNLTVQKDIAAIDHLFSVINRGAQETNPNALFRTMAELKSNFDGLLRHLQGSSQLFDSSVAEDETHVSQEYNYYQHTMPFAETAVKAFDAIYAQYAKDGQNPLGRANFARVTTPLTRAKEMLQKIVVRFNPATI